VKPVSSPRARPQRARIAAAVLLSASWACDFHPRAADLEFALSARSLEALADAPAARAQVEKAIATLFGTPQDPRAEPFRELDAAAAAVPRDLRAAAELYRVQCLHCHGVEGGGDGPTAHFLEPAPRDFRLGIFKFTAQKDLARPRREDILRALDQGLNGTSMPSFQRLSIDEREGLTDYVRFLAVRGEVEKRLVDTFVDEGEIPVDAPEEELAFVTGKWREAYEKVVAFDGPIPSPTPELIEHGRALFHDMAKGNCSSCHGLDGRGDGPTAYKIGADGQKTAAYLDAWGRPIVPRDLRRGLFRGGSRPIDIYRRIYAGIPGGPMPAIGEAKAANGEPLLSSDDLWALVHYVRWLAAPHDLAAGH
jgi:mono/diheme cytochrome c family protein